MNRNYLTDLIRTIAEEHNYNFVLAHEHAIAGAVRAYPAAWLTPPVMLSKTGRRHGRIRYSVRLRLLAEGLRMPPPQRARTAAAAEQELIEIFTELSTAGKVAVVDELRITMSEFTLTPHGEMAATADAVVETIY